MMECVPLANHWALAGDWTMETFRRGAVDLAPRSAAEVEVAPGQVVEFLPPFAGG
jgi:molybdopterin converting factor small subunit